MKILMTTDTAGGVWSYSTLLCEELTKARNSIVLTVMGSQVSADQDSQIRALEKSGVRVYFRKTKLEWMYDAEADVEETGKWLRQLYEKESPDLIHFNNYGQVSLGWEVPVLLVAHSCVASWWQAVKDSPFPSRFDWYYQMVKKAFQAADVVVSPSEAMRTAYSGLYGGFPNHTVIPNGIHLPSQMHKNKKKMLFSAGRIWDEGKNISLLLEAAPEIKADIFIAGPVENEVTKLKNVIFLGELSRTQVSNWMRIALAYVMPVKYEPFGLSFLEAGSHATPLVGGQIEPLTEIWADSMLYVNPSDKKQLARICNTLITDQEFAAQHSKSAYNRSKNFSLDKMGLRYLQLYESLISGEKRIN